MNMANRPRKPLWVSLSGRADFLLAALVGALLLATVYYRLLLQVTTLEVAFDNLSREPVYRAVVLLLIPATLGLFGFNFSLAGFLFRARGGIRWQGGTLLGALAGGFGAACPVCGSFLLSLVGVTAGLSVLPFAGLEFWGAAIGVMSLTLWRSLKAFDRSACDPKAQAACWHLPQVEKMHVMIGLLAVFGLLANLYLMLNQYDHWLLR